MSRKLKILFHPVESEGHVNSCIGLAEALHARGHTVIFVTTKKLQGKFIRYGFEEDYLVKSEVDEEKDKLTNGKTGQDFANQLLNEGFLDPSSPIEKLKIKIKSNFLSDVITSVKKFDSQLKLKVEQIDPDIIVVDHFAPPPSLINSGKPWVWLISANPLYVLDDDKTPPGGSGLPANFDKNSLEYKEYKELKDKMLEPYVDGYNEWLEKNGYPPSAGKLLSCLTPHSPYLNIYQFPEELDYTDLRALPDNWRSVDTFIRQGEEELVLPQKLKNRGEGEKLIYFSLGSMSSVKVSLMERLINILSKSPHKFIVSKGMLGHKYELADNMWGENSVPQTKVLPLVDLVITHGGNNTITETLSFGKPMIVMPLFGDQLDNAQRVEEKGFGLRMDAHYCTEEELLGGIEKLLNDKKLKARLDSAVKRIKESNSIAKAAQEIERLVYQ